MENHESLKLISYVVLVSEELFSLSVSLVGEVGEV